MNDLFNQIKNSWFVPVIFILLVVLFFVKQTNFSIYDHIAHRVIDILDADYSPYGPNGKMDVRSSNNQEHRMDSNQSGPFGY